MPFKDNTINKNFIKHKNIEVTPFLSVSITSSQRFISNFTGFHRVLNQAWDAP